MIPKKRTAQAEPAQSATNHMDYYQPISRALFSIAPAFAFWITISLAIVFIVLDAFHILPAHFRPLYVGFALLIFVEGVFWIRSL